MKRSLCEIKVIMSPLINHCLAANSFNIFLAPLYFLYSQIFNYDFIIFRARWPGFDSALARPPTKNYF